MSSSESSSDVAIRVEGLSKSYSISHNGAQPDSLRELLVKPFQRSTEGRSIETFWALKNVSFEVERGDVVGVIGRNGAGKSTLLKILSRVAEPTAGRASLHGRVGSLLEVGTGFHPELTGRENVYLNGAILGMGRKEIDSQFDSIVDFSGVEKFLDTPVKRYSSGMYVRLAFAVAAHLESEILILDEVLAVGDSTFQKKCLGKIQDVASNGGRTVLFVSHSMNSVLQLCNKAVYLQNGTVRATGPAAEVAGLYINDGMTNMSERIWSAEDAPGNEMARLLAVRVMNAKGEVSGDFTMTEPVILEMEFAVYEAGHTIAPVFHVFNEQGICMFSKGNTENKAWLDRHYEKGVYRARCVIPAPLFNDGGYNVTPIIVRDYNHILANVTEAIHFELHDDGSGRAGYTGPMMGVLRPAFDWDFEEISAGIVK